MGLWSWLFGKKDYKNPTATKKKGRQPGAPYGSCPKKPSDEIEVEFEFGHRMGRYQFARLTHNSVLVRTLIPTPVDSKNAVFGLMQLLPSGDWVEYRTELGVDWVSKDGEELPFEVSRMLRRKLKARELF